jgi:hypothetical protein
MRQYAGHAALLASAAALLSACGTQSGNGSAAAGAPEALLALPTQCDTPTTPFCASTVPLPSPWSGNVFQLSQNYPQTPPAGDAQPWLAFDPTTQSSQYIQAALGYFYAGNIQPNVEDSFNPALNHSRGWYNAPWQDYGFNGREPVHGLTRERVSQPGELDRCQTSAWNNYAVGFYNAAGATTIGQIWASHGNPNPAAGSMPEGTVAAKLLFTTADPGEVPYLAGAPTWNAYVYGDPHYNPPPGTHPPTPARAVLQVRLLQIDIAVKDHRAPTGWVFGTFVYGGGPQGGSAPCPGAHPQPWPIGTNWTGVAPVGLMWGNDPGYQPGPGTQLRETWLNPAVHMPHVGWQGRLNGPVDNPISSCLSCHSTAQLPNAPGGMIPNPAGNAAWFRNIPSGTPFATNPPPNAVALDYSLQNWVGLNNFYNAHKAANPATPATQLLELRSQREDPTPPRDGGGAH